MKIEKNKLVNQDIQLGIIAYSVAEMASIIDDCTESIKSAKEICTNLDKYVECKND